MRQKKALLDTTAQWSDRHHMAFDPAEFGSENQSRGAAATAGSTKMQMDTKFVLNTAAAEPAAAAVSNPPNFQK